MLASPICDEVKKKYSKVNKQVKKKKFVVPRKKNLKTTQNNLKKTFIKITCTTYSKLYVNLKVNQ